MRPADLLPVLRGIASRNIVLKVVALALAVAAWWFVAGESKVLVGFSIPLEIRNVPAGMTMTNKPEREVEVRLSGPASLLSGMRPSEISVGVDLSAARAGRQYFTLDDRTVKVPSGVKLQRIYPNAVEVWLERLERKRLPVVARLNGGAESRRRIAKVQVVPSTLEVEALPDEFARMKNLQAFVTLPAEGKDVHEANARVELKDGHAKILGNPDVRVTVYFRK